MQKRRKHVQLPRLEPHFPLVCRKTFRFIHALAILGIIEIVPHPNNPSLHIRVVEYDKWVGAPDSGKQKKKTVNEKFRLFWNEFHSITQLPKENIAKAQREWKN